MYSSPALLPLCGCSSFSHLFLIQGTTHSFPFYAVTPQICWVQAQPGGVQMPQLSLQHTSPTPQVFEPHVGPETQPSWVQGTPGFSHIPQLSLQHTRPSEQMFGPHCTPIGTHCGLESTIWQVVFASQRTMSHVVAWTSLRLTGLAMAPSARAVSNKALTERALKDVILFKDVGQ